MALSPNGNPKRTRHRVRLELQRRERSGSKRKQKTASGSSSELSACYDLCSLVLVGAAGGWIEGFPMSNAVVFREQYSLPRNMGSTLPGKVPGCVLYVIEELNRVDPERFFGDQIKALHYSSGERIRPDDELLHSLAGHMYKTFLKATSKPITLRLPTELDRILDECSYRLALTQVERDVFAIAMIVNLVSCSFSFFSEDVASMNPRLVAAIVSKITGHAPSEIMKVISPSGGLARIGVLDPEECLSGTNFRDFIPLSDNFRRWIATESAKEDPTYELLNRVPKSELSLSDFAHLKNELDLVREILLGALSERKKGINILFLGPPGSGKTEAAKAVCQELSADLFQVDYLDDSGAPMAMDALERMKSYNLGQRLLAQSPKGVLLFDEIEDVIEESIPFTPKGLSRSKAYTNNLLETNAVPTVWIANRISRMDQAWLRRFSYVLEMPIPPRRAREQILARMLARCKSKMKLTPEFKRRLFEVEGLSAGQIKVALQALDADVITGTEEPLDSRLELLLREPLRLTLGKEGLPKLGRYHSYDIAFVNALGADINHVVNALERNGRGHMLLSGPPGSGKTGLAHHVAQRLGKPLMRKTAADLLGPFVGQTEAAIARMFSEATRNDAVLLLDEADGLLRSREAALRSWEVTQVNEMLSRMEDFEGIFICSTNHGAALDAAAMRRFLFKLDFGYLKDHQALALMERHLGFSFEEKERNAVSKILGELKILTPADFSNVTEKIRYLGADFNIETFLDHLRTEVNSKFETKMRKMGFGGSYDC